MAKPFAIHPGEILLTEFMQPLGLTSLLLACRLDVPQLQVEDIVLGNCSVSDEMASRLGKLFDLPAQFWMNLQADYESRVASGARL